jgi:hypothetical protein
LHVVGQAAAAVAPTVEHPAGNIKTVGNIAIECHSRCDLHVVGQAAEAAALAPADSKVLILHHHMWLPLLKI